MKRVEFVRIKSSLCGGGLMKGGKYSFIEVEEIIKNGLKMDGIIVVLFLLKLDQPVILKRCL